MIRILLPYLLLSAVLSFFSANLFGQPAIDTIKVYNVNGSYESTGEIFVWGGNWTAFFPSEDCPEPKEKYYLNYQTVKRYVESETFFWMKLYNTNDELIFEGLKYSDCTVGKFICYYPNGQVQLTGEYGGYKIKKGNYVLKKCLGKEIGTWVFYDESGKVSKTITK